MATTASRPSALAPGLPTVASTGLPGYEAEFYDFLLAPANTPAPIINRLNRETVRFLNQPEVKQKFLDTGGEVFTSTPQEYTTIMLANIAKWRKVINEAGIKADN